MNYNKLVDAMKVIARDFLRMKIVVRLQSELAMAQDAMNSVMTTITNTQKDIARLEYRKSLVDNLDPDAEAKLKNLDESLKDYNEELVALETKATAEAQKTIDEINKEIEAVQNGEKKVNLTDLNEYTKVLLAEVTKDAAITAAQNLASAEVSH